MNRTIPFHVVSFLLLPPSIQSALRCVTLYLITDYKCWQVGTWCKNLSLPWQVIKGTVVDKNGAIKQYAEVSLE